MLGRPFDAEYHPTELSKIQPLMASVFLKIQTLRVTPGCESSKGLQRSPGPTRPDEEDASSCPGRVVRRLGIRPFRPKYLCDLDHIPPAPPLTAACFSDKVLETC